MVSCRKPVKLDVKAAEVARKIWEVLRIRTFQIIILQADFSPSLCIIAQPFSDIPLWQTALQTAFASRRFWQKADFVL